MRDNATLIKHGNKAQVEKLELPENAIKDDFDKPSIGELHNLLLGEIVELDDEIMEDCHSSVGIPGIKKNLDYGKIRKEAADVANFAHMIIYKCDQELAK